MQEILSRIRIKGFKSFGEAEAELRPLNILIGANSVGKSNLVSLFAMLVAASEKRLQEYIVAAGGPDAICHYGQRSTPFPMFTFFFKRSSFEDDPIHNTPVEYGYSLRLAVLGFDTEQVIMPDFVPPEEAKEIKRQMATQVIALDEVWSPDGNSWQLQQCSKNSIPGPGAEPKVLDVAREGILFGAKEVHNYLSLLRAYQFHDISPFSKIRQECYIHDNGGLRTDAANLAAFLYYLRECHSSNYRAIVDTVRQVFPSFGDFDVSPLRLNKEQVKLNWREKGRDLLFSPRQLSDGLLRFIALAALLLQPPSELPPLVVIDEPELGLHPFAISVLASLLRKASRHCQVIVATQSVTLVDQFDAGDIVIVEREKGTSTLKRLDEEKLKDWLEDYSLGELWEKNVLGGRPSR